MFKIHDFTLYPQSEYIPQEAEEVYTLSEEYPTNKPFKSADQEKDIYFRHKAITQILFQNRDLLFQILSETPVFIKYEPENLEQSKRSVTLEEISLMIKSMISVSLGTSELTGHEQVQFVEDITSCRAQNIVDFMLTILPNPEEYKGVKGMRRASIKFGGMHFGKLEKLANAFEIKEEIEWPSLNISAQAVDKFEREILPEIQKYTGKIGRERIMEQLGLTRPSYLDRILEMFDAQIAQEKFSEAAIETTEKSRLRPKIITNPDITGKTIVIISDSYPMTKGKVIPLNKDKFAKKFHENFNPDSTIFVPVNRGKIPFGIIFERSEQSDDTDTEKNNSDSPEAMILEEVLMGFIAKTGNYSHECGFSPLLEINKQYKFHFKDIPRFLDILLQDENGEFFGKEGLLNLCEKLGIKRLSEAYYMYEFLKKAGLELPDLEWPLSHIYTKHALAFKEKILSRPEEFQSNEGKIKAAKLIDNQNPGYIHQIAEFFDCLYALGWNEYINIPVPDIATFEKSIRENLPKFLGREGLHAALEMFQGRYNERKLIKLARALGRLEKLCWTEDFLKIDAKTGEEKEKLLRTLKNRKIGFEILQRRHSQH